MKLTLIALILFVIGCTCPNPKRYDIEVEITTLQGRVDTLHHTVYSCDPPTLDMAGVRYGLYITIHSDWLQIAENVESFSVLSYKEGGNYIELE